MAHPYRSQFTLTLPGKGTISTRYHFGRTNSAGSRGGFGFEINSGIVPGSGPPIRCIHSMAPQLLAADDGVALNFDLGFGNGQGGDGDERAAGEIVAEYFPSDLGEAVAVAHVGDEHCHLHHIAELAAGFSSVALMSLKICRTCPSRSPASDLPESSTTASCPASHTILPPSVITACE